MKLFRTHMEPSCAYCRRGTQVNERDVACLKYGIVPPEHACRAFRYDPLKRIPPRPAVLNTGNWNEADFTL